MLIDARTKISELIKHHPDVLETIVTLSPDFKKLRNPVLRALMAKRTTIAMAAKVGGCTPDDFFRVLAPLGFQIDEHADHIASKPAINQEAQQIPLPNYLQDITPDRLITIDVRTILAEGTDPLKSIQQKVKSLLPGQILLIVNNFEPVPLIKLLEKQGFRSHVRSIDTNTIETYFYQEKLSAPDPGGGPPTAPIAITDATNPSDWEEQFTYFRDRLIEIDVRHLEMPMPMMTILEQLEILPQDHALYVHHKRIPVFLLSELKDRDFDYRIQDIEDGEVYLLIFKNS